MGGPPHAFAAPRHQGARRRPLGSPDAEARLRREPGSFAPGAQWGLAPDRGCLSRGAKAPPTFLPSEKRQVPESPGVPVVWEVGCQTEKHFWGKEDTHVCLDVTQNVAWSNVGNSGILPSAINTEWGADAVRKRPGPLLLGQATRREGSAEGRRAWRPVGLEPPESSM